MCGCNIQLLLALNNLERSRCNLIVPDCGLAVLELEEEEEKIKQSVVNLTLSSNKSQLIVIGLLA